MTLAEVTAPPAAAVSLEPRQPDQPATMAAWARFDLPSTAVGLACAWWLIGAARWWGGRGPGAVTVGAALTAIAVLAIQPQRFLPVRVIATAVALSAAALGVALLAPTGWAGACAAASYVCAGWTVVAVAAGVIRRPALREVVIALLVIGVLVEVAEAWLPWWGGETAAAPILGTFYWYDPFAAYLIAGTVIGLASWLWRRGAVAWLGLAGCALGSLGLVYSTSRAAGACCAIAILAVGAVHLWRHGRQGASRILAALAVTAASVWAIAGPPFFAHRVSPFAGTSARAAGQSLGQNGQYRMDFWHEAIGVFDRHPLVGGGFHSLATASVGHVPHAWPLSPVAHNGYLQALSDGGLLLGVPFLLAVAAIAWWTVRALVAAVRSRDVSVGGFVVPLALAGLLAHSAVDFDWTYAANFMLVAVLAGLVVAGRYGGGVQRRGVTLNRVVAAAVLAGVALTGVAAVTARSGDLKQSLPIAASTSVGGTR